MTTPLLRFLKPVLIPALLATGFFAANSAAAASITGWTSSIPSSFDDGAENAPPADFSGWFLTFDPSNQWTSAENIATMESWLAAAEQLGNNPFADNSTQLMSPLSTTSTLVPEPATLGLLGIALAILLIYVPIRRPHRPLRN